MYPPQSYTSGNVPSLLKTEEVSASKMESIMKSQRLLTKEVLTLKTSPFENLTTGQRHQ